MKITASGGTHIGRVRSNNEDNFYINGFYKKNTYDGSCLFTDEKPHFSYTYAVCDGVGGAEFGELASLYAVEGLKAFDGRKLDERLSEYIESVNQRICDCVSNNDGKRMGSTLALLFIKGKDAYVCNIGDSRVYLLREGKLTRLSHDHTRRQSMIDYGLIKNESEPVKDHVLTQFLGVFPEEFKLDPHIKRVRLKAKDTILLCSDGLTDMVSEEQIRESLINTSSGGAEEKINDLICAAINAGGRDNVTAVIVMAE